MHSIQRLLQDHDPAHSNFTMDHFITGAAGLTVYGMYRQALAELSARVDRLKSLDLDIERMRANLNLSTKQARQWLISRHKRKLAEIEAEDLNYRIRGAIKTRMAVERELTRFQAQADTLLRRLGRLDPTRVEELDRELCWKRVVVAVTQDLLSFGRVQPKTWQLIWSLPKDHADRLISMVNQDADALVDSTQQAMVNLQIRDEVEDTAIRDLPPCH